MSQLIIELQEAHYTRIVNQSITIHRIMQTFGRLTNCPSNLTYIKCIDLSAEVNLTHQHQNPLALCVHLINLISSILSLQ